MMNKDDQKEWSCEDGVDPESQVVKNKDGHPNREKKRSPEPSIGLKVGHHSPPTPTRTAKYLTTVEGTKDGEVKTVSSTTRTVIINNEKGHNKQSQQPNIAQRPFCIQHERQDILYHLQ